MNYPEISLWLLLTKLRSAKFIPTDPALQLRLMELLRHVRVVPQFPFASALDIG